MYGKRSRAVVEEVPARGELWVKGRNKEAGRRRGGKGPSQKNRAMPNKGSCEKAE